MSATVAPPPYMLGERPTPPHGGSGRATFRQVPFVRVSERVENGVRVRKQLRKYLKASSAAQHMVAQTHLSGAWLTAQQQPQEASRSSFDAFFAQLRAYNEAVGQKHLEASKAFGEMARPLDHAGRARKWARDAYNAVQKSVQEVALAEKKMDKAKARKERAEDELLHWRRVLEANEATYQVQPNSPEVIRAYQLAQYRFSSAFADDEAATNEYEDARTALFASIERRDQVVEEATELSQSVEEDRLDTMLIVMNQFVETKVAILQAEIEGMSRMQKMLRGMEREAVLQQYVVDAMQPELTHRHAKALFLLEWHRQWHHEQLAAAASEPANYLALSQDDVLKVKAAGLSPTDVDVIKDFVASCFADPDPLLQACRPVSTRHRSRFTDAAAALAMYRLEPVRSVVLNCLNQQRTHSRALSAAGYAQLAAALRLLLDACAEREDTRTVTKVMNMIQTFYATPAAAEGDAPKAYLHAALADHAVWSIPQFWGNALLLSVGDELSKNPPETAWHILPGADRAQLVLGVHNIVFGQATSFIYHMATFGFARKQIFQYAHNVCFAYELAEDQRIALFASVQSLALEERAVRREPATGDEIHFSALTLSDWTTLSGGVNNGQKFRPFLKGGGGGRSHSVVSDAPTARSIESSVASVGGSASVAYGSSSPSAVRLDLEEMKSLASVSAAKASSSDDESWEDLFGAPTSASGGGGAGCGQDDNDHDDQEEENDDDDDGAGSVRSQDSEKPKRAKKPKNSRQFNDQLRLARALPLSRRMNDEQHDVAVAAVAPGSDVAGECAFRESSAKSPSPHKSDGHSERRSSVSSRQSVDDGAPLERKRSSRRLSKAKSAAHIDTSSLAREPPPPPPLPPKSVSGSGSGSGMDQIKALASQMKLRRRTADRTGETREHAVATEESKTSLRRSQSGTASVFASSRTSESPRPAALDAAARRARTQQERDDERNRASGVAAMRARFEKL
ncbi:hypothetical protein PybrP1_002414 [[Pythium] brassicae (nom. inval.)]|nr:hypothetical protein PybrP1_002414 [[Pythium] brassicae (nom. inval.)]